MKKAKQDMVVMLVIMILSALMYTLIIPWQVKAAATESFTNRTFPRFTMAAVFLAATGGFVSALMKLLREKTPSADGGGEKGRFFSYGRMLPLLGFLVVLCYALLFWYGSAHWRGYGFIVSTALFIPAFLLLLRCKKWTYYVSAYAFAAGMYVIFRFVLKVMLR